MKQHPGIHERIDRMDDLIAQIKADEFRIHQPHGFATSKEKAA